MIESVRTHVIYIVARCFVPFLLSSNVVMRLGIFEVGLYLCVNKEGGIRKWTRIGGRVFHLLIEHGSTAALSVSMRIS